MAKWQKSVVKHKGACLLPLQSRRVWGSCSVSSVATDHSSAKGVVTPWQLGWWWGGSLTARCSLLSDNSSNSSTETGTAVQWQQDRSASFVAFLGQRWCGGCSAYSAAAAWHLAHHNSVWGLQHRELLVLLASFLLCFSTGLAGTFKKSFFRAFAMQY